MEIRDIQRYLSLLTLYAGKIDNLDGPKTQSALDEFMEQEGAQGDIVQKLQDKIATIKLGSYADADGLAVAVKALCQSVYLKMPQQWAYIMATAEWETARSFYPVEEAFYLKDERARKRYLEKRKYHPFYGRGLVQLTWDFNYLKYSQILGRDLLVDPDIALEEPVSLFIMIHGMATGTFTGRSLHRYINQNAVDYVNARRIVNGTDKAQEIAKLAEKWEKYYESH